MSDSQNRQFNIQDPQVDVGVKGAFLEMFDGKL